jgi:hypothetical protein
MSTHGHGEAASLATRAVLLERGTLAADSGLGGAIDAVLSQAAPASTASRQGGA